MTTVSEISLWFDRGVAQQASHMLVVCDTFDNVDFPVFANGEMQALAKYAEYSSKNLLRIMEVYDLRLDKRTQMSEARSSHLPVRPAELAQSAMTTVTSNSTEKLGEWFDLCQSEYLKFGNIVLPLHHRPDLCAFLMLAQLVPNPGKDIISAAANDEIFLAVDCDKLANVVTQSQVCDLVRCGIRFNHEFSCLNLLV